MLETNTKNWEKAVFEKGADETCTIITENMIKNGMSNAEISKLTGLTLDKIARIRRKIRQK